MKKSKKVMLIVICTFVGLVILGAIIGDEEKTNSGTQSSQTHTQSNNQSNVRSHSELFSGITSNFHLANYCSADNSYTYISSDNTCWVDVYGDSVSIVRVFINTEARTEAESDAALEFETKLIENALPGFDAYDFLLTATQHYNETRDSYQDTYNNVRILNRHEITSDGAFTTDIEIWY